MAVLPEAMVHPQVKARHFFWLRPDTSRAYFDLCVVGLACVSMLVYCAARHEPDGLISVTFALALAAEAMLLGAALGPFCDWLLSKVRLQRRGRATLLVAGSSLLLLPVSPIAGHFVTLEIRQATALILVATVVAALRADRTRRSLRRLMGFVAVTWLPGILCFATWFTPVTTAWEPLAHGWIRGLLGTLLIPLAAGLGWSLFDVETGSRRSAPLLLPVALLVLVFVPLGLSRHLASAEQALGQPDRTLDQMKAEVATLLLAGPFWGPDNHVSDVEREMSNPLDETRLRERRLQKLHLLRRERRYRY